MHSPARIFAAVFAVVLLLAPVTLFSATPSLVFTLTPGADFPVAQSADNFTLGGAGWFAASYRLALDFPLLVGAELGYSLAPLDYALPQQLHVLSAGVNLGTEITIVPRLPLTITLGGGYHYGLTRAADGTVVGGGNPYARAGMELAYRITPRFALGLGGGFQAFFGSPQPLLTGVTAHLAASYRIPLGEGAEFYEPASTKPALLRLSQVSFDEILPVNPQRSPR
jgi:hypothetical protein